MSDTQQTKLLTLACTALFGLSTFFCSQVYFKIDRTVEKVSDHDIKLQKQGDDISSLKHEVENHEVDDRIKEAAIFQRQTKEVNQFLNSK